VPSPLQDLVTPFTREQQPIVAAGTVAVTQDGLAVAPGEGEGLAEALAPKGGRPLRVLISDCRVMVDRESRDAVWAAGVCLYLSRAFKAACGVV
jgi:hypothetical protein